MSKQTEALKLALEALKQIDEGMPFPVAKLAQAVIHEALAEESSGTEQPVPVAWFPPDPPPECKSEAEKTAFAFGWFKALEAQRALDKKAENARELVHPPRPPAQRKPLTDEELYKVFPAIATYTEANKTLYRSIARAIEAAHGIKGETK
jgi:hypothetical protein